MYMKICFMSAQNLGRLLVQRSENSTEANDVVSDRLTIHYPYLHKVASINLVDNPAEAAPLKGF